MGSGFRARRNRRSLPETGRRHEHETQLFKRADFPAGFQFGTATSSYQIEGRPSVAAAVPLGHVRRDAGQHRAAKTASIACDHYHRWEEDLDLIRDAGFDAYRFSTSWARVQPDGKGAANPEGLDFYDRLVDGMLERGIKPYVTLYHWDLPARWPTLGGWQNRISPTALPITRGWSWSGSGTAPRPPRPSTNRGASPGSAISWAIMHLVCAIFVPLRTPCISCFARAWEIGRRDARAWRRRMSAS